MLPSATQTLRSSPRRLARLIGLWRKRTRKPSSSSASSGISAGLDAISDARGWNSRRSPLPRSPARAQATLGDRVDWADLLADIAAEDLIADQRAQLDGIAATQLDGEIRDAAPVVQDIRRDERAGRAGVQADLTLPQFAPSGGSGSRSRLVTISDRKTHDPQPFVRMQVFLPYQPRPDRCATARSTILPVSTKTMLFSQPWRGQRAYLLRQRVQSRRMTS